MTHGRRRAAFVTAQQWRDLLPDDRAAAAELEALGWTVDGPLWDDPAVDWTAYDIIVLRSPWDYYRREAEFRAWIDAREADGSNLWNPPATLRWNLDKIYLQELADAGVAVVPTRFVAPDENIADAIRATGWDEVVVKPRISAAGYRTLRISDTSHEHLTSREEELVSIAEPVGAMVQPFLPEILDQGEWSFIFFAGRFSHSIVKRAAPGEFRIQEEHGGTVHTAAPDPGLIAQAEAIVKGVDRPWLYARVDGCVVDGTLLLMELEILEPGLFLLADPAAAARFAAVIDRWKTKSGP